MAENISWLKKADAVRTRRTLLPNLAEINSTMTMNSLEAERVMKPAKRKSCLMFQDRRNLQMPSEKKVKPNGQGKTEFRNRTLKMVQGRPSMAQRTMPVRQPSQLPCARQKQPLLRGTPLHMSTPCDPPRSILKSFDILERIPAAKKVNFDSVTEGVLPLEDSTIPEFTQYDLQRPTVSKVDIGTNTDEHFTAEVIETEENSHMTILFKKFECNIISAMGEKISGLEKKLELMAQSSCSCKKPLYHDKTIQQFMTNLDAIREVSENVTPSMQEESDNATPNPEEFKEIPIIEKNEFVKAHTSIDMVDATCSGPTLQPVAVDHQLIEEKAVISSHSHANEPGMPASETYEASVTGDTPVSSEGGKNRRSARLQCTSPDDPLKVAQKRLKNIRKRNIPRYLKSFELSPRPKNKR